MKIKKKKEMKLKKLLMYNIKIFIIENIDFNIQCKRSY